MFVDVPGYEGLYVINKKGVVKSLPRPKGPVTVNKEMVLKPDVGANGYLRVTLCKNGKKERVTLHRLVYMVFAGPIPIGYEIHHKDFNRKNNDISNLELVTNWENAYYSAKQKGYKLTVKDVLEIRNSNLPTKVLAEKYGVRPRQISRIKKYDRWNIDPSQYRAKPIWEGVETN